MMPVLQRNSAGLLMRSAGKVLTVNDDGTCCCGGIVCTFPDFIHGGFTTCTGLPSSISATVSGVSLYTTPDFYETETAGNAGFDLSGVTINGTFTLTSDADCPAQYDAVIATGLALNFIDGPFSSPGVPIPIPFDIILGVTFANDGTVSATIASDSSAGGTGLTVRIHSGAGTTRAAVCDRVGVGSLGAGLPMTFPSLSGSDLNVGYGGTVTV